jgi:polyphosphate glucokinase
MKSSDTKEKVLCIDIGGSNIKAIILDNSGNQVNSYQKIATPANASPTQMVDAIKELIKSFPPYNKVSVGFPGYVRDGMVYTAPNLGTEVWKGTQFCNMLMEALKKPVRLLNDADIQGLGVASGKGLEIVVTLGTGFGTAILMNGRLLPHLELAHHPITKNKTYDEYIGDKALEEVGEERWNKRISKVIDVLKTVFNYDHLYIGGGNSKKINFKLDDNISLITNKDGITGGIKLWKSENE